MANISKIKLPNANAPYQLVDSTALHSSDIDTTVTSTSTEKVSSASAVKQAYDKGVDAYNHANSLFEQLGSFLAFKGTKTNEAQIKALTSARVGDVWLESTGHSEWICIKDVKGTANASSWEKLGIEISAASTTHTHNVTSTTGTVSKAKTTGSVTTGTAPSFKRGIDSFSANTPTAVSVTQTGGNVTISVTKGTAASFTQGTDTFTAGTTPSNVTLPTFDDVTVVTNVKEATSGPKG